MTSGAESFRVPIPRIRMVTPSLPGLDEVWRTITPALRPDRAAPVVVTGLEAATSWKSTVDTDPVRLTFFWVP